MSNITRDIRAALESHLNAITSIPTIAWENVSFQPTTGQPFINVQFTPSAREPAVRGINPQKRYTGFITFLVCTPQGSGPNVSQDIVDSIVNAFEVTTDISYTNATPETFNVHIRYTEQGGSYVNEPWYVTPINIGYLIYK